MLCFSMVEVVFMLSLLIACLMGVGINIYVGYRDLDLVLSIFMKSYAIEYYGRPREWSFSSRLSLAHSFSGIIGWSSRYLRNGMLDPEEFSRLPKAVVKRMQWSLRLTMGGGLGAITIFMLHFFFDM